ncbi:MAG: ribosome biogenesis GTPase Der [Leptospiraceae bacterium]|nr:ribosome biogenesis GTPase Der [Leptospiraceae bacterium]MDW7975493.1 ribosome biogenesis GTPase Der [Leptospiraceae bacterium]
MITKKKLLKIAIVGKKNVGKSSLINLLSGKQRTIVDDYPGLTRDVIEVEIQNFGIHALFYDLPGLDVMDLGEEKNELERLAREKAYEFIKSQADVIIHLMEPPSPSRFDFEFREYHKKELTKPIIEAVNKIDSKEREFEFLPNFFEANFSPIGISALSKYNVKKLISILAEMFPQIRHDKDYEEKHREKSQKKGYYDSTVVSDFLQDDIRITIVGKPNVGKSTLFNLWAGKEISLVSDIPGTTRDTIDTVIRFFGKNIRILDTAGLRKRKVIEDHIEFISSRRTIRAIQDSDIVILVISAPDGITKYDKKIVALVKELNRAMILFVNKWDLIENKHDKIQKEYLEGLYAELPYLKNVPILFGSAKTKKRATEPLKKVLELYEKLHFRISTSQFNRYIQEQLKKFPHNQKFKIYYATQVAEKPLIFVLFCNHKSLISSNFISFLENRIREDFQLYGVPIRMKLKEKTDED